MASQQTSDQGSSDSEDTEASKVIDVVDDTEDDEDDVAAPDEEEDEEDDDDEDVHPSDVEADLEEILRDRMAAGDDDEDDETPIVSPAKARAVAPPRSGEWTCTQCFLIVSVTQFGSRSDPMCPSGEDPCESMERVRNY